MIRLRPQLRLFQTPSSGGAFLEAVVAERAVPLTAHLHGVIRVLAQGPVTDGAQIHERSGLPRAAVNAALSTLHGLGLLQIKSDDDDDLWSRLSVDINDVPVIDQVELTNICPMQCVMCPTGTGRMTRKKANMSEELFARVVNEAAAAPRMKPLTLHNLGESLLHPQLASFVALAGAQGLQTELAGNPGHLPLDRYLALEQAGLTRLILDVDGLDKDTLEAIRGPGARGDRAFDHLDALIDHRRRHPQQTPFIVLQMIRQQRNAHQHQQFIERYVDGASDVTGLTAYLKEVDANTVDADIGSGPLRIFQDRPRRPYLCRAPWRSVVVLVDGSVVPCCHDDNGAVVYGNLGTQTLREIWNGDVVKDLRRRMMNDAITASEPCFGCAHRADRYTMPNVDHVPTEPLHW